MESDSLWERAGGALAVTGWPAWPSAEDDERVEALIFGQFEDGEKGWALVLHDAQSELPAVGPAQQGGSMPVLDDLGDEEEPVVLDPAVASALLRSFLADWLQNRGWQVQCSMHRKRGVEWRLADCLAFSDGGGDRLDADYPRGADELEVLCESIRAIQASFGPTR